MSALPPIGNGLQDARSPVDTGGLWNHESYECILYGMEFLQKECDQWFGERRPPTQVNPAILQRLQMARQMLPPHELWLQQALGMQDYPKAARPKGWI